MYHALQSLKILGSNTANKVNQKAILKKKREN